MDKSSSEQNSIIMSVLWLKLTPTYFYEKDNDLWWKKYPSFTSERTEENNCLDCLYHNNECYKKTLCMNTLLTFSITNSHRNVLRSRSHNKLGTIVRV